jgi:sigma-B regulation protein RsbU (phosphoserine phosphatase)
MLDTLNEYKEKSPREILDGIHSSVRIFTGDAPQFDDLTIMCLEYK